jgi:hypothetical protein
MDLDSGIRDPGSGKNLFRIPDPGVKNAPDPGSRSATLGSGAFLRFTMHGGKLFSQVNPSQKFPMMILIILATSS